MSSNTEVFRISYSEKEIRDCFDRLRGSIAEGGVGPTVLYVALGGTDVRICVYDPSFLPAIRSYLGYTLKEESDSYEYTIVLWKTSGEVARSEKLYHIVNRDSGRSRPDLIFYKGGANGYDKTSKTFFRGYPDSSLETLINNGDIFVKPFYKILKETPSALVHGACVGIDGKGVLLCARGGKGKSTLTVSALLKGFEFVSDDYLILDSKEGELLASPIYSIIKLSYSMYERMRDEIGNAEIISDNPRGDKYVLDISNWHGRFRKDYPIRLCLMPEIAPGLEEPEIIRCSNEEKGQGIVHMVHSTMSQMMDVNDRTVGLKMIKMLQGKDFYRMRLTPDIYKNVEFLRTFLKGYGEGQD